jgi:hypothetical protein
VTNKTEVESQKPPTDDGDAYDLIGDNVETSTDCDDV